MRKTLIRNHFFIGDNGFSGLPGQKGETGPPGKNFKWNFLGLILYFVSLGLNGGPGLNGK